MLAGLADVDSMFHSWCNSWCALCKMIMMTNIMREAKTLLAALWPGTVHSAAPRPHCHPVDACCMHYHSILPGVYYLFWDAIATIASNLWRFTIFNKRLNYLMHFPQFIFQYDMRMRTISVLSFHLRCRQDQLIYFKPSNF